MDYEMLMSKGDELYIKEEYDNAIECFNKALKIKDSPECLNYIACCYIKLNQYDKAFNILKRLTITVEWERPWFNLGRIYMHYKDDINAIKCFEKALKIAPEDCDSNFYMGKYYENKKKYEKALDYYKNSLIFSKSSFDKADAHLQIAICYNAFGNYENAIKHLDRAYALDNKCLDALYDKAVIMKKRKKYDAALEILYYLVDCGYDDIGVKSNIDQCLKAQ